MVDLLHASADEATLVLTLALASLGLRLSGVPDKSNIAIVAINVF